ncbi:hypothetical protein Msi02_36850 [Microbispora siamensis]|uniref:Uncharacterized protein n=1 Tax=Microbispora siamensis TaxID=564413 RepID=A0ABQ4GNA3_9ACTN|nr:hypothetical protein Msi02_36850 [Microbispora siamensis]
MQRLSVVYICSRPRRRATSLTGTPPETSTWRWVPQIVEPQPLGRALGDVRHGLSVGRELLAV